jgi:uncharacterized protein YigA (DUF484 family)
LPDDLKLMLDAAQVANYLRAHPQFLADNPDLYRTLAPPARPHGADVADHMAAMIAAERAHAAAVLAASRAAIGLAARVESAVLALMRSDATLDCIDGEFPALLAVDAASICCEAEHPGMRQLPTGMVDALLGAACVVWSAPAEWAPLLHGEAALLARHMALIRVPRPGTPCLLALASRDDGRLDQAQGSTALNFLGRAVAAALRPR